MIPTAPFGLPGPTELRYFLEIAHSGNLSRAAERLGVTQPALSVSIKKTEKQIGAALLIRHRAGVQLTRTGTRFAAQARELLEFWDKLRLEAARDESELRGRYTIGCHASVALYSLHRVLPEILAQNSALEIRLMHDLSRKVTEEIISSRVDFGIVVNPIRHPELVVRKLFDDEVAGWSANGKLSTTLICDPDLHQIQKITQAWSRKGVRFDRTLTSPNLEVIASLTAAGCGVGILPTRVAQALRARTGQALKRCPGTPTVADEICLVWRADQQKSVASRRLAQEIGSRLTANP